LVTAVAFAAMGCGDDDNPAGTTGSATIATHTVTIENADYNSCEGEGFVNLYDGVVYNAADAEVNADKVDFRHQYRGVDIGNRRLFENMTNKNRWGCGDFTSITPTDSRIAATNLSGSALYQIRNIDQLLDSFDFTGPMNSNQYLTDIDDNPVASVYAFIDKNGKRGLFRVVSAVTAPIDTQPQGKLTIELKVEL
jgi:hypothetical protein